jgi:hypothetical protein
MLTPARIECRDGMCETTEARWQQAIYQLLRKGVPRPDLLDGSGCESGDALDVTLSEIKQALVQLLDQCCLNSLYTQHYSDGYTQTCESHPGQRHTVDTGWNR